jgi:hypothetical protein
MSLAMYLIHPTKTGFHLASVGLSCHGFDSSVATALRLSSLFYSSSSLHSDHLTSPLMIGNHPTAVCEITHQSLGYHSAK